MTALGLLEPFGTFLYRGGISQKSEANPQDHNPPLKNLQILLEQGHWVRRSITLLECHKSSHIPKVFPSNPFLTLPFTLLESLLLEQTQPSCARDRSS